MTDTCNATTAKDEPCQNPAQDNGFCWIPSHNPDSDDENPQGRDPKLTKQRQEAIAGHIENGKSVTSACRMEGIDRATFYNWMDRGEGEDETIYAEFFDRIVRARGVGEDHYVQPIMDIAREEGDLATLMSMLKQRYPESWGDVNRGEQAGQVVVNTDAAETTEIDPETLEVKDD